MKKLLFIMLLAGFSFSSARSQVLIALIFGDKLNTPNIEFGLNVGTNYASLTNLPETKYAGGLNLGLYFNFKLSDHFYLHPELMAMNRMGSKGVDDRSLPDPTLSDVTLETWKKLNYMTLVFLPRYKLTSQLYFEAGLRGSLLLGADNYYTVKPDDNSELRYKIGVLDEMKRLDAGFDVGLGFKFGKGEGVNLSLRFSRGFVNTLKDDSLPAECNRGFHIQVGIPIGVGKEDVQQQLDN